MHMGVALPQGSHVRDPPRMQQGVYQHHWCYTRHLTCPGGALVVLWHLIGPCEWQFAFERRAFKHELPTPR